MIAKFSVKKPYTVLVAVIMVIVLGVVSFTRMTTDLLPSIDLPYIIVMTTYGGASPETVEMVVTQPIEASMATVSNIENVSSTSNENYSMVMLEFTQTANMDSASIEIREKLDQISSYWDDSVGSPIIMKINPDMMPIMVAALGVDGMTDAEISAYAENTIVPELESIEGVASATATGLIEESVHVIIRQDKIDEINKQVFGAIDSEMADAEQEIADGWQEIYDSEKELQDGYVEIDKNVQELNDNRADLEDGKAELADGKAEIADGKDQLNNAKNQMAAELAKAEKELLTAKTELEANKVSIETLVRTVEGLQKQLEDYDAGVAELTQVQTAVQDMLAQLSDTTLDNQQKIALSNTAIDKLKEIASQGILSSDLQNEINGLTPLLADATEEVIQSTVNNVTATLTKTNIELTTKIDQQTKLIEELKKQIANLTKELGIDAFMAQMKEALAQINAGLEQVDAGLVELKEKGMIGSIDIAVGQAGLNAGESQLESAESQLDSALDQLDAAGEQIDSAREQLDTGKEQLADAKDQLSDGQQELADAKKNAYISADMKGILTVDTVKSLLMAQNFSMPGGYVTEEGIDYLVRIGDKPADVDILSAMPIMNVDMEGVDVIHLSDVADVFMTDNSADIYTNINGSRGVMLSIQKQTGYSTGDVSDKVKARFDSLLEENENLTLITLMDQGIYIELVMDSIMNNIIFGAGLAILILILFLRDLRPTFVIACSIPISLVTAIVCMYFSGVTLNVISLAGLALGIGMLVDNSIVVIENIYRLRNLGYSMTEAAKEGAREVASAIMASTLTTVCVFLPIVFTEGITKQLFVDMGLTIGYSLVASLVIALTVVPAMASKVLTKTSEKSESKLLLALMSGYEKVLHISLRFKAVVIIVVVVLLIVSIMASLSRGTAFMPSMDSNQLSLTVELPKGTPIEETAEATDEVITRIETIADIQDIGAMVGGNSQAAMMGMGGDSETNATSLYLTTVDNKSMSNEEIGKEIEALTEDMENVEIAVTTQAMDMSALTGSGIGIEIRGREMDTLQELAANIASVVSEVEGTAEVLDGMGDSTEELRIIVDRDKAIEHGMTVAQVFGQISAKLADPISTTVLSTAIKDYDVFVMDGENMELTRDSVQKLDIEVTNQDGTKEWVPLEKIATFEKAIGMSAISRNDQTRYIQVTATIADGYNVGLVGNDIEKVLADYEMPSGYNLVITGEDESINDAMEQVMLMMLLAIIFMYLIMVAQFQSLLSPFIIMFTIPLAFTGGFLGLYFTGSEVSVIGLIGFVMLAGIIVNNGIVLVDYINQLRETGMKKKEAIYEAGRTRLRPVLMTALTTILALSTMVFSSDMGSDMVKPMAIVTIGGLVYGTLLTLIVIPCIYDLFTREKKEKVEK